MFMEFLPFIKIWIILLFREWKEVETPVRADPNLETKKTSYKKNHPKKEVRVNLITIILRTVHLHFMKIIHVVQLVKIQELSTLTMAIIQQTPIHYRSLLDLSSKCQYTKGRDIKQPNSNTVTNQISLKLLMTCFLERIQLPHPITIVWTKVEVESHWEELKEPSLKSDVIFYKLRYSI
jgi:hypothetical protein